MEHISEYREKIDLIDDKIQKLFLERMSLVESIANFKMNHDLPVYDHTRETEVIEKNIKKIENSEYKDYYKEVLETIMKVSKEYQKQIIIRSTL